MIKLILKNIKKKLKKKENLKLFNNKFDLLN